MTPLSVASGGQVSRSTTLGKYGVVLSLGEGSERTFEPPVVDFGDVATVAAAVGGMRREFSGGSIRDRQAVGGRMNGEEFGEKKEREEQSEEQRKYMPDG